VNKFYSALTFDVFVKSQSTLVLILITLCTFTGCTTKKPAERAAPARIASIVVLPTETAITHKNSHPPLHPSRQLEDGAAVLSALIADYFTDKPGVRIISQPQQESLASESVLDQISLAKKIGTQVGGDAVLMSTVNRYHPRGGTKLSVDSAASVAFDYKLAEVKTGRILCSGAFDETQQAVFENMFAFMRSFKRGFRWITAEELAKEGLIRKFDDCPYLSAPH